MTFRAPARIEALVERTRKPHYSPLYGMALKTVFCSFLNVADTHLVNDPILVFRQLERVYGARLKRAPNGLLYVAADDGARGPPPPPAGNVVDFPAPTRSIL